MCQGGDRPRLGEPCATALADGSVWLAYTANNGSSVGVVQLRGLDGEDGDAVRQVALKKVRKESERHGDATLKLEADQ